MRKWRWKLRDQLLMATQRARWWLCSCTPKHCFGRSSGSSSVLPVLLGTRGVPELPDTSMVDMPLVAEVFSGAGTTEFVSLCTPSWPLPSFPGTSVVALHFLTVPQGKGTCGVAELPPGSKGCPACGGWQKLAGGCVAQLECWYGHPAPAQLNLLFLSRSWRISVVNVVL